MGTLKVIKGNLFDTKDLIIAHGCNCRGGFGSGVAGQIAKLYPEVRAAYIEKHKTTGWSLGEIQIVQMSESNLTVVNMATQDKFGYDGRQYVDYEAVRTCLGTLFAYAEGFGEDISLPWIGCGLAGGDRAVITDIIRDCLKTRDVNVTIYTID